MKSIEERLTEIEKRLEQLEQRPRPTPPAATEAVPFPVKRPAPAGTAMVPSAAQHGERRSIPVTQILGWTGATALVLAAAYLIRLALDVGWLTPARQLVIAVISGFALIATGLWLRASDRHYAGLLPAGGLVVLFLSIYGAHLFYHFIGAQAAAAAVIVVCLGSLWLNRLFESELYALFAVVGSYSAPFLLQALSGSVTDLALYYSAWSVLFCIYSVWSGSRRVYLLAAYMALLGFHFIGGRMAQEEWIATLSFQAIQFAIFLGGAIYFSIRHQRPMDQKEAVAHLPLLLIFYALQYSLLDERIPAAAPWIALGSAALLLLAYAIARRVMAQPLRAGGVVVGSYAALALFHAGYMELLPHHMAPWAALIIIPLLALQLRAQSGESTVTWPLRLLIGAIFAINYLRTISQTDLGSVPGHQIVALLYAVELYVAYHLARRLPKLAGMATAALYAGHVALMAAAIHIFDERLAVSLAWGVIAIACLLLSFKLRDKVLGRSSLLIFAASVAKVLLLDLSLATPLVRIGSLLVLGITLYLGGWMYKRVEMMESGTTDGEALNRPSQAK